MPPRHPSAAQSSDLPGSLLLFAAAAVGAAALETALVPGVLIGGAAWLAPKALTRLRRGAGKSASAASRADQGASRPDAPGQGGVSWINRPITTSATKTVTFRAISSGLDFGWNYFLLGEFAAAASLSGVSLIAAPTFYFLHESLWSRFWPKAPREPAVFQVSKDIGGVKVSKAMAKTVTFRFFATASEFGVNYFVARDLLMATKLSAFGIVAGPFVYLAHERAWERFEASRAGAGRRPAQRLLAPPTRAGD